MTRLFLFSSVVLAGVLLAQDSAPALQQIDRLSRWLRSPRESIREEAVAELNTVAIDRALPLLVVALSDSSTVVRAAAATSLSRAQDPRVVAALRPLLKDPDNHVRAAAVWGLCHTGGKAVLPDVLPLCLDDASGLVRFRAVWGLAIIGDKSAMPVAVAALGDFVPAVRERSALLALAALADDSLGAQLAGQAGNEFTPTRRIVMYLFSRYGELQQAVPVLQAGLRDGDPLVRAEAALALGRRRVSRLVGEVIPLLGDSDEHVRGAALHALGFMGDSVRRSDLLPMLQDPNAFVRAVAAEALQRLGEKNVKPPPGFRAEELFSYPIHNGKR
ncbi:MAG: hypothetical protein PCFJNLEI_01901 [Verrucomicrobiae bacterium]|nr:hypothetical protein [Verrucomicrobiae bacterium]